MRSCTRSGNGMSLGEVVRGHSQQGVVPKATYSMRKPPIMTGKSPNAKVIS